MDVVDIFWHSPPAKSVKGYFRKFSMASLSQLRNDFPSIVSHPTSYLDNAATTHKPWPVINAVTQLYTHDYAPTHRGLYTAAEKLTERYEAVRAQAAAWIGATYAHEIVFTKNATEAFNLVAQSWGEQAINEGDEIVVTALDHHANLIPWYRLAQQKKASLIVIPLKPNSLQLDLHLAHKLITRRTRLITMPLSSNIAGPVSEQTLSYLRHRAQEVSALFMLDAVQVPAHQQLSIAQWQPDMLTWSGHKMFAPTGVGILYIAQHLHAQLIPYQYGGGMVSSFLPPEVHWKQMPFLLEAGTKSIEAVIGLGAAMTYLSQRVNYEQIAAHEKALMQLLLTGIHNLPQITLLTDEKELLLKSHIVTFTVQNIHAHDVAAFLADKQCAVRAGDHCCQPLHHAKKIHGSVRVSLSLYNNETDIQKLLQALQELCKLICRM